MSHCSSVSVFILSGREQERGRVREGKRESEGGEEEREMGERERCWRPRVKSF
jgi:hypothetical protein